MSFLKGTICKTRSLKPDYRATITQSLMFIPVIRCEEEDLYFIVVECIQCCLVSASPSACLFGKHFPPPEARCNPCIEGNIRDAFSQLLLISLIMVRVLRAMPPEGKLLQSSLKRALCRPTPAEDWLRLVWVAACWISPLTTLPVSWCEVDCIGLP